MWHGVVSLTGTDVFTELDATLWTAEFFGSFLR